MDKNRIISTYDSISDAYDKAFSLPSEHIDEFLKSMKPKSRILDLGCGAGNNSVYLSNLGHDVIGVDLSDKMLALAKSKKSAAKFIKQDIGNVDFPDNSFDHIIAAYSLCYLPKADVLACLRKLHAILKKNGLIFIKLQEGASAEISRPEPFNPELTLDLNVMSQTEINKLLKDSNFSVLKTYSDEKEPDGDLADLNELCIIAQAV